MLGIVKWVRKSCANALKSSADDNKGKWLTLHLTLLRSLQNLPNVFLMFQTFSHLREELIRYERLREIWQRSMDGFETSILKAVYFPPCMFVLPCLSPPLRRLLCTDAQSQRLCLTHSRLQKLVSLLFLSTLNEIDYFGRTVEYNWHTYLYCLQKVSGKCLKSYTHQD